MHWCGLSQALTVIRTKVVNMRDGRLTNWVIPPLCNCLVRMGMRRIMKRFRDYGEIKGSHQKIIIPNRVGWLQHHTRLIEYPQKVYQSGNNIHDKILYTKEGCVEWIRSYNERDVYKDYKGINECINVQETLPKRGKDERPGRNSCIEGIDFITNYP